MSTSSTRSSASHAARRAPTERKRPVRTDPIAPPAVDSPTTKARPKLVRDSFTIPKGEYLILSELKDRAARLIRPVKKGELLRAGIAALNAMPDRLFLATLSSVPSLKPGRPKRVDSAPADLPAKSSRHRAKRG